MNTPTHTAGASEVFRIDVFVSLTTAQIAEFDDTLTFQKLLRTVWQHQEHVTYCLFGSKKHMMEGLFLDASRPFYKFGDTLYLKRIPQEYWTEFIQSKFTSEGKNIPEDICRSLCEAVGYNSYYVQQLAWLLFLSTEDNATAQGLSDALDDLVAQNAAVFESKTERLSAYQMHFLEALSDGVSAGFSRSEIVSHYKLGSSANVVAVRASLLEKDLIVAENGTIELSDPVLGLWLRRG